MLDENLPTFSFQQSPENPLSSIVQFTQNGSEPAPEYVFQRASPSNPAARNKYAVALTDPYAAGVVYAEVVISPEWSQPTLSAAEIRAQQQQNGGAQLAPTPLIPDNFTIQLYDPDQAVSVRFIPGSFTRTDSWEFEMLTQSFKMPSSSQLDRQKQNGEPVADFRPRVMFRWKKDSKLSRDMTCFNVGKSLGKHKSKEPDITVALFKHGRSTTVTVYEPNLQRLDMEDRKGLDIVLVLGAEVIRDLYLAPEKRPDLFNMASGPPLAVATGRRKNSRPSPPPVGPTMAMTGALGQPPQETQPVMSTANVATHSAARPSANDIDAETERLRAMVEREERERQAERQREERERERRDREEAKRIKKMLDDEEKAKRLRDAEVAKETERLKKLYGTEGQDLPSGRPAVQHQNSNSPPLPQRPQFQALASPPLPQQHQQQPQQSPPPPVGGPQFAGPPSRPLSVGPGTTAGPFHSSTLNNLFCRPSGTAPPQSQAGPSRPGRAQGPYLAGSNPAAAVSGFFQKMKDDGKKVSKKKSNQW
ncbi:hypothetical protein VP1G_06453 [Cytospora mali]|uniref:Uncharacterized protein n=1 Tax=Cytospora mali TaxID=578113 RepID=A0A194V5V1_CYTMA|nr:hypothetical protein VP1G_06453 [Valsa mali var. pyri (nom. inval.)]